MTTPGTPLPDKSGGIPSIPMVAEPDVDRTESIGALVKDASTHLSTLIRGEIELAKVEVGASLKQGLRGGAFFGAAAAIGGFSLFFFWFMVGEILNTFLPRWLAFTIVFVVMLLMAGGLAFLGYRRVKKIKGPEKTIATLTSTAESLKAAAKHSD